MGDQGKNETPEQDSKQEPALEEPKSESVSEEDMAKISVTKQKGLDALLVAEKAASEAKIADLEYRTTIQHIFIKYSLSVRDRIDVIDG